MSQQPTSLDDAHGQLDLLAMKLLELTQDLINAKVRMEKLTKEGYFLMAKAR